MTPRYTYISEQNINKLFTTLNSELCSVDRWHLKNKISLNISETNFMLIYDSKIPDNLNVIIRIVNLSKLTEIKFLGVCIDQKLTFKFHIDQLAKKISQLVGSLHRISPCYSL